MNFVNFSSKLEWKSVHMKWACSPIAVPYGIYDIFAGYSRHERNLNFATALALDRQCGPSTPATCQNDYDLFDADTASNRRLFVSAATISGEECEEESREWTKKSVFFLAATLSSILFMFPSHTCAWVYANFAKSYLYCSTLSIVNHNMTHMLHKSNMPCKLENAGRKNGARIAMPTDHEIQMH